MTATPGSKMPNITLEKLGGGTVSTSTQSAWKTVVVYRGSHCPLCKMTITAMSANVEQYRDSGVELIAITSDTMERTRSFIEETGFGAPVGIGLTVDQMKSLGVWITEPNANEAPAPYSEPAVFVVNPQGELAAVSVSSAPFMRLDTDLLLNGIKYLQGL